ncbi:MAG: hypothetical protein GXO91_01870 [FCB group bacterium]|nr:hypothetical protein [FCB group bacterium]
MLSDKIKLLTLAGILKISAGLILLFVLNSCNGDIDGFVGPAWQFDSAVAITDFSASVEPLQINGDTSIVSAVIVNSSDQPISGIAATFTSDFGTIVYSEDTDYSLSDSSGVVSVTYISGAALGTEHIYLSVGTARDTLAFEVISDVAELVLSLSETDIFADGMASTLITAQALNDLGDPAGNTTLRFATDRGIFSNGGQVVEILTDEDGVAATDLISEASSQDEISNLYITDVDIPDLIETLQINFIGISFQIETQLDSLIADGTTATAITARVKEATTGNPLSGVTVTWSTGLGVITSPTVTDEYGAAVTTLVSPVDPGTTVIEAAYGNTLTAELPVVFTNE